MTIEAYLWFVPIGALAIGGLGVIFAHVLNRRLERLEREGRLGPPAE